MAASYPALDEDALWALQIIRKRLANDPEYFNSPDCPYPDEVKKMFSSGQAASLDEEAVELDLENINLEAEVLKLYKKISEWGATIGTADKAEQNTFFRLSTQLQERLVAMMERTKKIDEIDAFKSAILSFADDHMNPSDRTKFMDYIGSYISND